MHWLVRLSLWGAIAVAAAAAVAVVFHAIAYTQVPDGRHVTLGLWFGGLGLTAWFTAAVVLCRVKEHGGGDSNN